MFSENQPYFKKRYAFPILLVKFFHLFFLLPKPTSISEGTDMIQAELANVCHM